MSDGIILEIGIWLDLFDLPVFI